MRTRPGSAAARAGASRGSEVSAGVRIAGLTVDRCLFDFVSEELLSGVDLAVTEFWGGLARLVADLAPQNRELLAERERLQGLIDEWHRSRVGESHDPRAYQEFLTEIGYLRPEPQGAAITTTGVDVELSQVAGPQLVVPATNARFAINAVNARWGSLYDAVYGSDVIAQPGRGPAGGPYDPARGAQVVAWVRQFLDRTFPLVQGSHAQVCRYQVVGGSLVAARDGGAATGLSDPAQLLGYRGSPDDPSHVLLTHHGLGVELRLDRQHPVGALHPAGLCDVQVEAAVTTIVDLEDSVAAVDAEDKVVGYRNWLGLNRGTLAEQVTKDGVTFTRTLNHDRRYTTPGGSEIAVPGRSLMLVRNVGLLMQTDAVLDAAGDPVPEGILDAVVTTLAAIPGAASPGWRPNSSTGSVYLVKPKMHGPDEVAFTVRLLAATEALLGLPPATVKVGIMDEERRTSVNLAAAIEAAADRVVFINTGFLDRTGDEIHTSMEAGVMVRKSEMRSQPWIAAYEDANVDTGLALGMGGRAQIGKGMWAMPDLMADMVEQKIQHPAAGASTAWVPSPTAAVLHALHYHAVDVSSRQSELLARGRRDRLAELLTIPLAPHPDWTAAERRRELENNAQSILGYVVRWIDQGIGCSKVPDTDDVALMEDRATLRISSQLLANWLRHGVLSQQEVLAGFTRMAAVVDRQNAADLAYRPMTADLEGNVAFLAALELVVQGAAQPSGYTEPILHRCRRQYKTSLLTV